MAVRRSGSHHAAQPLNGVFVSGNSFSTLGLRAYAARLLRSSDDHAGATPVAVMRYQTWEAKYGGNPDVIGAGFLVNGTPVTVVGIAPPGYFGVRLTAHAAPIEALRGGLPGNLYRRASAPRWSMKPGDLRIWRSVWPMSCRTVCRVGSKERYAIGWPEFRRGRD